MSESVVKAFSPDIEQQDVIVAPAEQWMLVNAGPGTGKTQISAMRIAYLLSSGLYPAQVLVLSFSRSAVRTLSRRIGTLELPDDGALEDVRHLTIRTFDAWAFRVLRQSGVDARALLARSYEENIEAVTALLRDDGVQAIHDRLRVIRHVVVDEFQDLPGVRSDMVIALLSRLNDGTNGQIGFTVLGDPAQAIYRFAALASGKHPDADPWIELKQRFANGLKELELTRNHRSVLKLAEDTARLRQILRSSTLDPSQKLEAMRNHLESLPAIETDSKIGPDLLTQLPEGSLAILTRTNGEAIRLTQMLRGRGNATALPVKLRLAGQTQGIPAWIGALLGNLKLQSMTKSMFPAVYNSVVSKLDHEVLHHLQIPSVGIAWQRLLRASGASDNDTSLDMIALRERLAWPDSFPDDHLESDNAAVHITTVHQAKGMEFDNVALLEAQPRDGDEKRDDPLEEANVGFVAITRAGRYLVRLSSSAIYRPPYEHELRDGRKRYVSWVGLINVQAGLPGDIDAISFVSTRVHSSEGAVSRVQSELMRQGPSLRGRKVELRKTKAVKAIEVRYDIVLLEDDGEELLLGRTCKQLTADLLDLLWGRGYNLPFRMFNLRIADVVSLTAPTQSNEPTPEPWRTSRLWLGVTLTGTADFKGVKRHGQ